LKLGEIRNKSWTGILLRWVAIIFTTFQIYTASFGVLPAFKQRLVHLSFALAIVFLSYGISQKSKDILKKYMNYLLFITIVVIGVYGYLEYEFLWLHSGNPATIDVVMGITLVIVLIEATRRMTGMALPILSVLFIFYTMFGRIFPGELAHGGHSISRIANDLCLTTSGIFSVPLAVSSTVVGIYIIFAVFLQQYGAGNAFLDLAKVLVGHVRGGPAKIAVLASSLFGTISGTAVGNTVATGSFTIPLMKKMGFKPYFAAAVEATASTGGQLMPPIMGAAAFIMVEFVGVPYMTIITAAIIPALLYYIILFLVIDQRAIKSRIKGIPKHELPSLKQVLINNWYLYLPVLVLLYFLVIVKYSPMKSGVFAIFSLLIVVTIAKKSFSINEFLDSCEQAGYNMVKVALLCACAGIVIGLIMLTGLGLKLSSLIIVLAGGYSLVLLGFTMIVSIILGMGLPTSACYILLAILVAPAMTEMGINILCAHFFVFYMGLMANITPPVAIAAFAAAGIADADPTKTGYAAFKLALPGLLIPYYFVYRPELLLVEGTSFFQAISSVIPILVGLVALATALSGYFMYKINKLTRVILIISSLALVYPSYKMNFIGACLLIIGGLLIYKDKGNIIIFSETTNKF